MTPATRMKWATRLACWLSALLVTLVALVPWGGSETMRLTLAMLPALAMLFWAGSSPGSVSAVLPFLVGGLVDCIGQGPIGYWMLVYLLGHAAAVFGADAWRRGFLQLWTGVGATLALLGLAGWLLACGYHFRWLDWRPFALAAAAATLLFPLLAVLLTPLRWLGSSRALLQLGRGG